MIISPQLSEEIENNIQKFENKGSVDVEVYNLITFNCTFMNNYGGLDYLAEKNEEKYVKAKNGFSESDVLIIHCIKLKYDYVFIDNYFAYAINKKNKKYEMFEYDISRQTVCSQKEAFIKYEALREPKEEKEKYKKA